MYRQCYFSQGDKRTSGWIAERGAKIGALVELDNDGFWRVDAVGDTAQSREEVDRTGRTKMPSIN